MRFVPSPTGSKLLAGGWWGISRHINYFGDWLLALGMSLPTGACGGTCWRGCCVQRRVHKRRSHAVLPPLPPPSATHPRARFRLQAS